MPAELDLDHTRRLVHARGWDLLTAGDLFALVARIRELLADGTIDAGWSELVDFRDVTQTERVPTEAVRTLARENPWPPSARRVIVAPATAVFGISRMYQLLTASVGSEIAVVQTEAQAQAFLGGDPSPNARPSAPTTD